MNISQVLETTELELKEKYKKTLGIYKRRFTEDIIDEIKYRIPSLSSSKIAMIVDQFLMDELIEENKNITKKIMKIISESISQNENNPNLNDILMDNFKKIKVDSFEELITYSTRNIINTIRKYYEQILRHNLSINAENVLANLQTDIKKIANRTLNAFLENYLQTVGEIFKEIPSKIHKEEISKSEQEEYNASYTEISSMFDDDSPKKNTQSEVTSPFLDAESPFNMPSSRTDDDSPRENTQYEVTSPFNTDDTFYVPKSR